MNIKNITIGFPSRLIGQILVIFALYVQTHGDYSPGGGFQAGALLASNFILYSFIYGYEKLISIISIEALKNISAFGVLLYIGVGIYCLIYSGNFLQYDSIPLNVLIKQATGITIIELGVGITVTASMLLIYLSLKSD